MENGNSYSELQDHRVIYQGRTGELYGLWLKKLFLSILTLGIYSFWGKTNIRKYMAASTSLKGDSFEWFGTGKELFMGFLKISPLYVLFLVVYGGVTFNFGEDAANSLFFVFIFFLLPMARYAGLRYRVNRFSWRGVRFHMTGSAFSYGLYHFLGTLKILFTLGLMSPSVDLGRVKHKTNHMAFGNIPFAFEIDTSRLGRINLITLLLAIPTLFFSRIWYTAALYKEIAKGLSLGEIRFQSSAEGSDIFKLFLGNIFIVILTLGFGIPIAMQRRMQFMAKNCVVYGDVNALVAAQAAHVKGGKAEGIEDALGIGDEGLAGLAG